MLWWIPPTGSQVALAAYYGMAYLLCDAAATFVYMPYFSLTTLMHKVAASLVVPAALLLLDWSGYVPNAAAQAPKVLAVIRALVGATPSILLICGMGLALLYPLDRQRHLQVRKALEEQRARRSPQA